MAWNKMLSVSNLNEINSIADVGANIGRNISFLKQVLPIAFDYAYDINCQALEILKVTFLDVSSKSKSLLDLGKKTDLKFDFVFTSKVLI
jgi:hypothetical protein